ncbi:MAG: HNH endonuclease [Polynucleobacter victoriensis]
MTALTALKARVVWVITHIDRGCTQEIKNYIKIIFIMLGKIRKKLITDYFSNSSPTLELICPICDRKIPNSQKDAHHLVPKSKGGKTTQYLHRICHRQIHALYSETKLAKELNTADAIKDQPEMQKFIEWVKSKPDDFYERTSKSKKLKSEKIS